LRLHENNSNHAGIIACTVDADFVGLANRIHAAIISGEALSGRFIRVNRPVA
jgi:hypothetical protein